MKRLLSAFLFSVPMLLFAQSGDTLTPLRVVEKYVSPNGFPEKLRHFCCEMYHEWMAPQTLGQQLPATVQRDAKLMYQDTGRAVINVWFHDSITSMDVYFYLQHRAVWTVYAVRTLAMKTTAEAELLRLDSIPEKGRGKNYTKSTGHTWKFDYNNTKLWGSSDTVLVAHFYSNRKLFVELETLRNKKYPLVQGDSVYAQVTSDKKIRKKTDKLLVRDIIVDKYAPGCVLYLLGGVLDNSVGYLYQPDPTKVPPISAGYFILVRPLGNGWYLYKTT
jgi:hypothetical protein